MNDSRERQHITRADVEVMIDALIERGTRAFVHTAQQAGHTAAEIETILEIHRDMQREWRQVTRQQMIDEMFGTITDAPAVPTVN